MKVTKNFSRNLCVLFSLAMIASCDLYSEPTVDRVGQESRIDDARELCDIHREILSRFYTRGVSLDEARAVADARDETAALDLLGMTRDEATILYGRLIAVHDDAPHSSGGGGGGIGPVEDGNPAVNITVGGCSRGYSNCLLAVAVGGSLTSNPGTALIVWGVGGLGCFCSQCHGGVTAYLCF